MPVYPNLKKTAPLAPSEKQPARLWVKRDAPPGTFKVCEKKTRCRIVVCRDSQTGWAVCNVPPAATPSQKDAPSAIDTRSMEDITLLADIITRATEVFGDKEKARHWLSKPLTILQKKSPLQYAATKAGADFVLDILGRIEYGVFS